MVRVVEQQYNENGIIAGEIRINDTGDVFYFTSRKPEHFFEKYGGFGISEKILKRLNKYGVDYIYMCRQHEDLRIEVRRFKVVDYITSPLVWCYNDTDNQRFVRWPDD